MAEYPDIPPLRAVGVVHSPVAAPDEMPPGGVPARVEVFAEYAPALDRLEEHSHAWLLTWFHAAAHDRLHVRPSRADENAPEYGVFALRAFMRPNPIGLTLIELGPIERSSAGSAYVDVARLDAVDATPVLDIKPYFENDVVFSPRTPYLRPRTRAARLALIRRHALAHHLEDCPGLRLAVRMALLAEERFGHLNEPDIIVEVVGSPHVADALQGITRARLANPARFAFQPSEETTAVRFSGRGLTLDLRPLAADADWLSLEIADEDLLQVEESTTDP